MKVYEDPHRTNIVIGKSLKAAAVNHAKRNGIASFSEYVARLCVADMRKSRSAARAVSRFLPASHSSIEQRLQDIKSDLAEHGRAIALSAKKIAKHR
jgi:hypothetical protein